MIIKVIMALSKNPVFYHRGEHRVHRVLRLFQPLFVLSGAFAFSVCSAVKFKDMKKAIFTFLFVFAIAALFGFMLNPCSTSAFGLVSNENEGYTIQINNLNCELTDYEIDVDLWHASVVGSHIVTLNNSGDTKVSIRWNDGSGAQKENEMIVPANTVKKYSVNFYFHLLSRDFSYEYEEI